MLEKAKINILVPILLFYSITVQSYPNLSDGPNVILHDLLASPEKLSIYMRSDDEILKFIKEAETKIKEFIKSHVQLNCLAIPIKKFADILERWLTQTEEARDVRFQLHTRSRSSQFVGRDFNLKEMDYDIRRGTVVIVHGFWSRGDYEWVQDMKNALLKWRNLNVLVVDWERGSFTWNYLSASIATRIVGVEIAKLLDRIELKVLTTDPVDPKEWGPLHFVGHSLGAHICAHAAHLIAEMNRSNFTKWAVNRITGLDPAQPCFIKADSTLRLDKGDAEFVDVIHTNGKSLVSLGLGLPDPVGHVDFYPNGGEVQVGCKKSLMAPFLISPPILIGVLIYRFAEASICSHGRSYELFTDSIYTSLSTECTYVGHKWNKDYDSVTKILEEDCSRDTCPEMGINSVNYPIQPDGIFYVPTSGEPPYCKNVKKTAPEDKSVWRSIKEAVSGIFG